MSTFITGIGSMLGVGSPSNENVEVERKSDDSTLVERLMGKPPQAKSRQTTKCDVEHHTILLEKFPAALPSSDFQHRLRSILKSHDLTSSNTLLSTSFCCDEVNRGFENMLSSEFSRHSFNLGGLSGFPFAGRVGVGAMASHIPENGNAVIVYGPHVGFSNDGIVGKVERKGIKDPNGCCGSAIAAMKSICSEHKTCHLTPTKSRLGRGMMGKKNKSRSPTSVSETQPPLIDIQQYHVCQQIKTTVDMGSADRISLKSLPAVNLTHESLPTAVFDAITPDVDYLLGTSSPQPSLLSKAKTLVVVGGILINTASKHEDYFLPLRFQLFNEKYEKQLDLLGELNSFGTDNESN